MTVTSTLRGAKSVNETLRTAKQLQRLIRGRVPESCHIGVALCHTLGEVGNPSELDALFRQYGKKLRELASV
eukprot:CAMPEP_0114982060 /NCGR_PEP_ID=MMETSP0216-20121206/5888_1 /TAXON_ID=223996 /ORGANISM="Protocruzia adherens, Strain Boccale" /LENGTH=71 /DNA_ID=CAMNT_0002343797 /DNA_START=351 /DNA_END=566 /DNA_ORIENTATION=-